MLIRRFKKFLTDSDLFVWSFIWGVWLLLIAIVAMLAEKKSLVTCFIIAIITIAYTIIVILILKKKFRKENEKEAERKNQEFQQLKEKCNDYIRLVDEQTIQTLNKLESISDNLKFIISSQYDYLITFSNYLDWICKNRITGKPDSFIIATCLMYSLIKKPKIVTEKLNYQIQEVERFMFSINLDIAIHCALKIISEPTTYYEENGEWIEEKHPKVNISIPKGIIKNSDLYQRIINTIYQDYHANKMTSIMEFSNLLHLIYLNSQ